MTYLHFHLIFTLPLLAVMVTLLLVRGGLPKRARWAVPLMAVIAVLYATPWDNYLVYREIWRYPMDRILFRIWHVPVEEYFFFIVQSLIQSTLLLLLLPRSGMTRKHNGSAIAKSSIARWRLTGFLCYSASAIAGVIALIVSGRALYLGLILAWAAPVLAAQWWWT